MVDNFLDHFSNEPFTTVVFAASTIIVLYSVFYYLNQNKKYGTYFEFASKSLKVASFIGLASLIGVTIYSVTPYKNPPADQMALVIGDTQNTPRPSFSKDVKDRMVQTMLQNKGKDADAVADSVILISASLEPDILDVESSNNKLRDIGNNSSNAERNALLNIEAIEAVANAAVPSANGVDYLEAIFKAKDNLEEGASIVVIGSGLSDTGILNFSLTNILTNEYTREETIDSIQEEYGRDYLEGYSLNFYGLGDTNSPQEPLSTKQKETVREIYSEVIKSLGGEVDIDTSTLNGASVDTGYVVGTTDTGCGDIGLIFNDDNLKFVSNDYKFVDSAAAKESLNSIKDIYNKDSATIASIQIDGYIAHYGNGVDTLSQPRADAVKSLLLELGIPTSKLVASGRGYGPYENDLQNRMVKVTVSRDNELCGN